MTSYLTLRQIIFQKSNRIFLECQNGMGVLEATNTLFKKKCQLLESLKLNSTFLNTEY